MKITEHGAEYIVDRRFLELAKEAFDYVDADANLSVFRTNCAEASREIVRRFPEPLPPAEHVLVERIRRTVAVFGTPPGVGEAERLQAQLEALLIMRGIIDDAHEPDGDEFEALRDELLRRGVRIP